MVLLVWFIIKGGLHFLTTPFAAAYNWGWLINKGDLLLNKYGIEVI